MNTAPNTQDLSHLDMVAIEKRARALRAEAIQNFFASVKSMFAGIGSNFGGQRA